MAARIVDLTVQAVCGTHGKLTFKVQYPGEDTDIVDQLPCPICMVLKGFSRLTQLETALKKAHKAADIMMDGPDDSDREHAVSLWLESKKALEV